MNDKSFDELLGDLIASPQDRESLLKQSGAAPEVVEDLRQLASTADAIWVAGQAAPPLEEDAVAMLLGLVPDDHRQLNPKTFKASRTRSHQSVSDVARALAAQGWAVQSGDVLRWQTSTAGVSPALIRAIAEVLVVTPESITSSSGAVRETDIWETVRSNPVFASLVGRWAAITGLGEAAARLQLSGRMYATVHRGGAPEPDQILESLRALVETAERRNGRGKPDES